MGALVDGDDGMLVEDVGAWTKDKHNYLARYVDISRGVRAMYTGKGKAGATYIDPFCGPGRCRVRETGEYIDGGALVAWKKSVEGGSPYSQIFIGDIDEDRLKLCARRLEAAGARNVVPMVGAALDTIPTICSRLSAYQLHFAFVDPYNLGTLDFALIEQLSRFKRMDMLVHVSEMDLQRNGDRYAAETQSALDRFYPGWRDQVDTNQSVASFRRAIIEGWRDKVATVDSTASAQMKRLTGGTNQRLYWLLLLAKHERAHEFWEIAANAERQGDFGF